MAKRRDDGEMSEIAASSWGLNVIDRIGMWSPAMGKGLSRSHEYAGCYQPVRVLGHYYVLPLRLVFRQNWDGQLIKRGITFQKRWRLVVTSIFASQLGIWGTATNGKQVVCLPRPG